MSNESKKAMLDPKTGRLTFTMTPDVVSAKSVAQPAPVVEPVPAPRTAESRADRVAREEREADEGDD